MWNRRLFLKGISLGAANILFVKKMLAGVLPKAFFGSEVCTLESRCTFHKVKAGEQIILPREADDQQQIQFEFEGGTKPKITSREHLICGQKDPIFLDEPCSFSLIFNKDSKNWTLNLFS